MKFVDKMVEIIRALDEVRPLRINTELYFNCHFVSVHQDYQDIFRLRVKLVFNFDNSEDVRIKVINPLNFVI